MVKTNSPRSLIQAHGGEMYINVGTQFYWWKYSVVMHMKEVNGNFHAPLCSVLSYSLSEGLEMRFRLQVSQEMGVNKWIYLNVAHLDDCKWG